MDINLATMYNHMNEYWMKPNGGMNVARDGVVKGVDVLRNNLRKGSEGGWTLRLTLDEV